MILKQKGENTMKKMLIALAVVLGLLLAEQVVAEAFRNALCSGVVPALVLSGGALLVALGVLAPQVYCVLLFAALGTVLWSLWQLGRSSCRAAA